MREAVRPDFEYLGHGTRLLLLLELSLELLI
jgi:hypothetical protein